MKNKSSLLALTFGVQLVIALAMFLSAQLGSRTFNADALINVDRSLLDRLVIEENGERLSLSKKNDQWFFSNKDLLIDQNKFDRLVDTLFELKTTWPATTTSSSHERFEVSEKKFRKRITLGKSDDDLATLFVGSAPGFKQVHLRLDGQQEVYALDFDAFSVSAKENDWLDTSMLSISAPTKITGGDFTLEKIDGNWQIEPLQEDHEVIQSQAENLVRAIESLAINGLASETMPSESATDTDTKYCQ